MTNTFLRMSVEYLIRRLSSKNQTDNNLVHKVQIRFNSAEWVLQATTLWPIIDESPSGR